MTTLRCLCSLLLVAALAVLLLPARIIRTWRALRGLWEAVQDDARRMEDRR